jgi:hypothetical protein
VAPPYSSLTNQVRALVNGGATSVIELTMTLGHDERSRIYTVIKNMINQGKIVPTGRGTFKATGAGLSGRKKPARVLRGPAFVQARAHAGEKRCPHCWQFHPLDDFMHDGRERRQCSGCREKYRGWEKLSPSERISRMTREDPEPLGFVMFRHRSGNKKTGPIPTTMSERGTCPPSCSFYAAGCYALYGHVGAAWKNVGEDNSITWTVFLETIARLPQGQLWRHNVAGDLRGYGDHVDPARLSELASANRGKRGFTFTHKPLGTRAERDAVKNANAAGFTVNLSADTLSHADRLSDLGIGPVAVVVDEGEPHKMKTPAGRHVIVCPAQRHELKKDITCMTCGLCALPRRKAIIAFRAHGQASGLIPEIVRRNRLISREKGNQP